MSLDRKIMLCQFFRNELSESDIKILKAELPLHYHLIYHVFDLLRDNGADKDDIENAKIVDGNVILNLSLKSLAKKIEKSDSNYFFGNKEYSIKIRRSADVVSITSKCISD